MTTPSPAAKWFILPRPNPQAQLRLFCFPYAGGGASIFRTWGQQLPPQIEVYAVQLPGRENRLREPAFTELAPLVSAIAAVLPLDRPYALFGHSMGAIIAFELARALRRRTARPPVQLLVSGRVAPQATDPEPPLHQLPNAQFVAKLRELNGIPQAILDNAELMELLTPLLRADLAVNEAYAYYDEPPLQVPISAFGGFDDPKAGQAHMQEWAAQTRADFSLHMFPGDHFFLNTAQAALLAAVARELQGTFGPA